MSEFEKLFLKLINEEWIENIPASEYHGLKDPVKVYKNPSQTELMSCVLYDEVRAFLLGDDMWVWSIDATHHRVINYLGMGKNQDVIPLIMYIVGGLITGVTVTDYSEHTKWHMDPEVEYAITNNRYIQLKSDPEMVEDPEFVSYYNEAEVGRWDEISEE